MQGRIDCRTHSFFVRQAFFPKELNQAGQRRSWILHKGRVIDFEQLNMAGGFGPAPHFLPVRAQAALQLFGVES